MQHGTMRRSQAGISTSNRFISAMMPPMSSSALTLQHSKVWQRSTPMHSTLLQIWRFTSCNRTPSTLTKRRRISEPITGTKSLVSLQSTWSPLILTRSEKTGVQSGICSAPKERSATKNAGFSQEAPISAVAPWTTSMNSLFHGLISDLHLATQPV